MHDKNKKSILYKCAVSPDSLGCGNFVHTSKYLYTINNLNNLYTIKKKGIKCIQSLIKKSVSKAGETFQFQVGNEKLVNKNK